MGKDDATQQVLDLRQRMDSAKTRLTEARIQVRTAEDALSAADDSIRTLGLDPDRDLERQVIRLVSTIDTDLGQVEAYLTEVEAIVGGDGPS